MSCAAVKAAKHSGKWTRAKSRNGVRTKMSHKPATRISYCPVCPIKEIASPQMHPRTGVKAGQKFGSCVNGHSWEITGSVYHG